MNIFLTVKHGQLYFNRIPSDQYTEKINKGETSLNIVKKKNILILICFSLYNILYITNS